MRYTDNARVQFCQTGQLQWLTAGCGSVTLVHPCVTFAFYLHQFSRPQSFRIGDSSLPDCSHVTKPRSAAVIRGERAALLSRWLFFWKCARIHGKFTDWLAKIHGFFTGLITELSLENTHVQTSPRPPYWISSNHIAGFSLGLETVSRRFWKPWSRLDTVTPTSRSYIGPVIPTFRYYLGLGIMRLI